MTWLLKVLQTIGNTDDRVNASRLIQDFVSAKWSLRRMLTYVSITINRNVLMVAVKKLFCGLNQHKRKTVVSLFNVAAFSYYKTIFSHRCIALAYCITDGHCTKSYAFWRNKRKLNDGQKYSDIPKRLLIYHIPGIICKSHPKKIHTHTYICIYI